MSVATAVVALLALPAFSMVDADHAGSSRLHRAVADTLTGDPSPRPTPHAWHCEPYTNHTIEPSVALRGEAGDVTATITVDGACRWGTEALHVVIALTGLQDEDGSESRRLLDGLLATVDEIFNDDEPSQRVGMVIGEGDVARTVLLITDEHDDVTRSVRRWHDRAASSLRGAATTARLARIALDRAAKSLGPDDHPEHVREVVIFVGDLDGTGHCTSLVREAERLKNAGVLVMTGCPGRDCDTRCLREVATSPRYAFLGSSWPAMWQVFQPIRHSFVSGNVVKRIDVQTEIGTDFTYVTDSAEPPPTLQDGDRLLWTLEPSPSALRGSDLSFSYRLRQKHVGVAGNTPIAARTTVSVWSRTDYPNLVVHRDVRSPSLLTLEPRPWPGRTMGHAPPTDLAIEYASSETDISAGE